MLKTKRRETDSYKAENDHSGRKRHRVNNKDKKIEYEDLKIKAIIVKKL